MITLPDRSQVRAEETWDLSLLYENEDALVQDLDRAQALSVHLEKNYKDLLYMPGSIVNCLDELAEIRIIFDHAANYAELAVETDHNNMHNLQLASMIHDRISNMQARLSFIDPELSRQPDTVLQAAMSLSRSCRGYLKEVLRRKPHLLSADTEKALASLEPIFQGAYDIYNASKLADLRFPSFTAGGKDYPLGYALFEDDYEYESDTEVRRTACKTFYGKLKDYENTTAAAYNLQVRTDKVQASLRGFDSVFDYLLFDQKVTREMYDRQCTLIMEHLAPHMRRYAKLIQKEHGLSEMTYADLKLPLDPTYDPKVTIEEGRRIVEEALSVLGDDYKAMVSEAFDKRWIDYAKNEGKCTGAFCSTPYRKGSFILLSWNNRMSDVFTIAHELGHAGHFKACGQAQSIFDHEVSVYLVESPSTMNELLMARHFLKNSKDKRFRRWVLSSMVSNTYYHNFVTHLLEAVYQREVYRIIDAGGSVQAESLHAIYKKTLSDFWGDDVLLIDGCEKTWMRQPHYYMGLYSYTYSAGLTVSTGAALRMDAEGPSAVEDWKKFLQAGGTLDPADLAAIAGVDITTDRALLDTIDYIGRLIDEIIQLSEELEEEN